MKIVQFTKTSIPSDYPAKFKRTTFYPSLDLFIGEYYGTEEHAEYTGELPRGATAIRIITVRAFYKRLPKAAKKNFRETAIDDVLDMEKELELAGYADLDDEDTVAGLNALGPSGLAWLTAEEVAAMLADGTEREKYNGLL